MKKLAVSKENPCKACLSCVRACSEAFYKTFDPDLSCIRITAKPDGEPKVNSCIMCGKCARTCPEGLPPSPVRAFSNIYSLPPGPPSCILYRDGANAPKTDRKGVDLV